MTTEKAFPCSQGRHRIAVEVVVNGRAACLELNPYVWDAFLEISKREEVTPDELCALIESKMPAQNSHRGDSARLFEGLKLVDDSNAGFVKVEPGEVTLTSAIRIFTLAYFHKLAQGKALPHDQKFSDKDESGDTEFVLAHTKKAG